MEDKFSILGDLIIGPPNFDYLNALKHCDFKICDLDYSNDDIASEHYSIFGMTVFPFGHYYLSEGRNFAGDFDGAIISIYQEYGFNYDPLSYGMGPTHLGTMLKFIQFTIDNELFHVRRQFIAAHILSWFKIFSNAIEETNSAVFKPIVSTIEKLLIEEWKSLNGNEHLSEISFKKSEFNLQKDLIENEKAGLKEFGEYFITPALSGVFISKATLKAFSQSLEIPIGFGDRSLIVGDIFREANNYEVLDKFSNLLSSYLDLQAEKFSSLQIEVIKDYWLQRIMESKKLITILRDNLNTPHVKESKEIQSFL